MTMQRNWVSEKGPKFLLFLTLGRVILDGFGGSSTFVAFTVVRGIPGAAEAAPAPALKHFIGGVTE